MGVVPGPRRGDCGVAQTPDLTLTGLWPQADLYCRSDLLHCHGCARAGGWRGAPYTRRTPTPRPMYVTDLTHFLDKSGAIGPAKGPARAMAQFQVDVVAHASDATTKALPAPKCFKCKKATVEAVRAQDDAIVWF